MSPQPNETDPLAADCLILNSSCPVTGNSTSSNPKQGGSITSAIITSEHVNNDVENRVAVSVPILHVTMTEHISADTTTVKGIQMEQHTKPGSATIVDSSSIITPSENAPNTVTSTQGAFAAPTMHNASSVSTEQEAGKDMEGLMGEQTKAPMEKKLDLLLVHLNEFLVSSPASIVAASSVNEVENQQSNNAISQMANETLDLEVPTMTHSQPIEEIDETSLALLAPVNEQHY